jgi:hypothetical protein
MATPSDMTVSIRFSLSKRDDRDKTIKEIADQAVEFALGTIEGLYGKEALVEDEVFEALQIATTTAINRAHGGQSCRLCGTVVAWDYLREHFVLHYPDHKNPNDDAVQDLFTEPPYDDEDDTRGLV